MRGAAETMAEIVLNTVIRGRTVSPRETSPHLLARLPLVASLLFVPPTVVSDPAGTRPSDKRGFPSDSSPIPLRRSLFLPFASLRSTYVRPRLNGFLKIHLRRVYRYALLLNWEQEGSASFIISWEKLPRESFNPFRYNLQLLKFSANIFPQNCGKFFFAFNGTDRRDPPSLIRIP